MTDSDIAAERKTQILDAAIACFARHGFHGATMPQICAEAGLSPGTVYRYFRSKDALIEALVELDRAESVAIITAKQQAGSVREAIAAMATDALALASDRQAAAVYLEVGAEAARNPRVSAIVQRHDASVTGALALLISQGQRAEEIAATVDAHQAAEMISALIDGLFSRKAIFPATDLDRLLPEVRRTIDMLLPAP